MELAGTHVLTTADGTQVTSVYVHVYYLLLRITITYFQKHNTHVNSRRNVDNISLYVQTYCSEPSNSCYYRSNSCSQYLFNGYYYVLGSYTVMMLTLMRFLTKALHT